MAACYVLIHFKGRIFFTRFPYDDRWDASYCGAGRDVF
jgi:hypothetical protein